MTLEIAIGLFVLAAAGIVLAARCLRRKPKLRIFCLALLSLIALALAGYIVLTLLFVYAVSHH